MRRKDREVTDAIKIIDVIDKCNCCRIGFNDNGNVYIVPLNFGYEKIENTFTFYFHGAKEGRKIDIIHKNPHVGFEMDTDYKLHEADIACGHSARFKSIIGNGVIEIVNTVDEKIKGLNLIMKHNTGKDNWTYSENRLNAVTVFKLKVTNLSCKEHN